MIEQFSYEQLLRSQLETIDSYRDPLQSLLPEGTQIRINALHYQEKGQICRGFRIRLSEPEEIARVAMTDWDDTIEEYFSRKTLYYRALYNFFGLQQSMNFENFQKICLAINKAARILGWQKQHPKRYSPFLEMIADTQLINHLIAESMPNDVATFIANPTNEQARQYIEQYVKPLLGNYLEINQENGKTYFVESSHQALAIPFQENPGLIHDQVWQSFVQSMTANNLSTKDLRRIDFAANDYWIITTFGTIEFQLEKIVNALQFMKKVGKRLPNEIIVITQGRKEPFISELFTEFSDYPCFYVDDSLRQLQELLALRGQIFRAIRSGCPRAQEPSDLGIREINLDEEPFSSLFANLEQVS